MSDFSQESFSGIAVIKAFVKEAKELMAFKKLNIENEKANIDYTRSAVSLRILVTLFVESVICVILGYGGYLVYKGEFNAGQLVEFIGYFTTIVWPVMAVSELIDMTSRGHASLKRISELLNAKQDVVDSPEVEPLKNVRGDIEFRHLNFTYPDGEFQALEDISFTICAGESVGLVGKTGSGKTTLVDLILRTYNVADGTIFIDGHDINTIAIKDVRNACAYVPQDNFLFSDTIENNISFGTDKKAHSAVVQAAVLADVDSNIKDFQKGYGTVLGERGVTVSGGQKQRISIARALMKDAPILIMDDSVSAVDTRTERTILSNLRETRAGKTTILHTVSGLLQPTKGSVIFEGQDITKVPAHKIVSLGMAHVPEGRRVFAQLTVLENLKLGAYTRKDKNEMEETLKMIYKRFPRLEERKNQIAGTLSGGEQQMLAMGRALMSHPKIILMDEPSMGLSPIFVEEVFKIIRDISAEGVTVLLVEQNAKKALNIADRAYVLETGNIILQGDAKKLMNDESVKKAYLGE